MPVRHGILITIHSTATSLKCLGSHPVHCAQPPFHSMHMHNHAANNAMIQRCISTHHAGHHRYREVLPQAHLAGELLGRGVGAFMLQLQSVFAWCANCEGLLGVGAHCALLLTPHL